MLTVMMMMMKRIIMILKKVKVWVIEKLQKSKPIIRIDDKTTISIEHRRTTTTTSNNKAKQTRSIHYLLLPQHIHCLPYPGTKRPPSSPLGDKHHFVLSTRLSCLPYNIHKCRRRLLLDVILARTTTTPVSGRTTCSITNQTTY